MSNLFGDMEPGETRVMSAEDYERLQNIQRQKARLEKEQEELRKQREKDEIKRLLPIKNSLQFSDELAHEVCERISAGELTIDICLEAHMPTIRRLNQWLRDNPEFQQLY